MITLRQVYETSLQLAIKRGPRDTKEIAERLKKLKEEYEKLDEKKKAYFDLESLHNPFLDSRIEYGDPNTQLKRVMVGIDIGVAELLLAHELNEQHGKKIDAVIAHHPEGRALIDLTRVMDVQEDIAMLDGVPINVAEKMMRTRMNDLNRGIHAVNHYQVPSAAKLLGIPFACFHTFADNQVYWFIKNYITKRKPKYVADIIEAMMELPEYQYARKMGNAPIVCNGDEKLRCGKISFSGFTGGTTGSKEIYEKMAAAGVGTMMVMHIPEEHRKLCEQHHITVIICGHMASDSLGVNLLMDELERKNVEIVECSGFTRVSRLKKRLPF